MATEPVFLICFVVLSAERDASAKFVWVKLSQRRWALDYPVNMFGLVFSPKFGARTKAPNLETGGELRVVISCRFALL